MMTPDRSQRVEEIFQAVVELAPDERERYLCVACNDDVTLKHDVENRLSLHDSGAVTGETSFSPYSAPTGPPLWGAYPADDVDPLIGRRLGAYQIKRQVGRGGMGAVYEAVRADKEFAKRVAIKLVKRGMDTDFILRRFRKERQILAALDHPHIALLLDGGTTDDGLPFFVMEFIEGRPLYRYSDAVRLNITERLKLFRAICDAVHYAHQKQVVHRDIKPSNVLVTAEGVPKLLDFGIAKLLNPDLVGDITHDPTATSMRLMTPEYASPEQVQGAATTPSTDVYSLGVLLYELLTGHRPYRLRNRAPHEIARVICEEAPVPLGVVLTRGDDLLTTGAFGDVATALQQIYAVRRSTLESLRQEFAGDLDEIVMRALRKEPQWRYQTVEQLRDDITSFLEGRPLSDLPNAPFAASPINAQTDEQRVAENSLAVLPLKLLDSSQVSDSGPDYLGTGLADALITRLSGIRRFAVRPTSSVLGYGLDFDPLAAGRELRVAFVLDGRMRRAGDRIRVTVQLLKVSDGSAVWAGQFDERFTDVLTLEDAISAQVAEALVPHLTGDERQRLAKRGTDNPQAHEAYLRGRYFWNTFSEEGFAKAIVCYHQAIALDPDYAAAYAGVAAYHNWLGSFTVLPFAECAASAYEAAAKAVAIDPGLAEAHAALGQAILCRDFAWSTAERELRHAIELNPDYSVARIWYAMQLAMEGRFTESLREAQTARDLDPMAIISRFSVVWCSYHARRFKDGYQLARTILEVEPHNPMMLHGASFLSSQLGRHDEAIATAQKSVDIMGKASHTLSRLGSANAHAGNIDKAEAILEEMDEIIARRHISPYHRSLVHSALGRTEQALDLLETAFETKDAKVLWMGVDPELDPLHGHPRFNDLLRKLNHRLAASAQTGRGLQSSSPITSPVVTPTPRTQAAENEEAQQLYTAGRYYATRRTADGLRQAIERLTRAVELEPGFALARSELADCYALLNWFVEPPPADAWKHAKEAALKAVEADPELAEAHASLGFVKLHYDRDWEGAERELREAIRLKPGVQVAHRWYAYSLSAMGRHEEAATEIERARAISPLSPVIATALANVLFLAGRFDDTIEQCHKALALDPGAVAAYTILRWAYEKKGMHAEALATYEQERSFAGDTPTTRAKRAHVLAVIGKRDEALAILEEILANRQEQWVTAYEIAIIYSLLDDRHNAFHWLSQAEREHAVGFTFVRVDPHLESLRSDPLFEQMLQRTGQPIA